MQETPELGRRERGKNFPSKKVVPSYQDERRTCSHVKRKEEDRAGLQRRLPLPACSLGAGLAQLASYQPDTHALITPASAETAANTSKPYVQKLNSVRKKALGVCVELGKR